MWLFYIMLSNFSCIIVICVSMLATLATNLDLIVINHNNVVESWEEEVVVEDPPEMVVAVVEPKEEWPARVVCQEEGVALVEPWAEVLPQVEGVGMV